MTLLLTRSEVSELLDLDACIAAVESAFRLEGEGKTSPAGILGHHVDGGGFHVKTAALGLGRPYFAAKINGNFPGNRERFDLPTIQGVVVLSDAENGSLLALIDSAEITSLRTAAATAVAAKYLARPDSRVAVICGCGRQARAQLAALCRVLTLRKAFAYDADANAARVFAREMEPQLGIEIAVADTLAGALATCDVCVTCTPSTRPLIDDPEVPDGVFLAAVGADAPEKQELDPRLLVRARLVVDVLDQCASIGELHHALEAGLLNKSDVFAELSAVVASRKRGRDDPADVVIFDSTGTALEDVAAAAALYERALAVERGLQIDLSS